jgi:Fic family protein
MAWNWELERWPNFEWQPDLLRFREQAFVENAAIAVGSMRHFTRIDRNDIVIELLSSDALSTSAIEGEILDRDSVQSSLRRQLGMSVAPFRSRPAEAGIAEMIADLYQRPFAIVTEERLQQWHQMVMNGRRDITDIGTYRRLDDPMQIISGVFITSGCILKRLRPSGCQPK